MTRTSKRRRLQITQLLRFSTSETNFIRMHIFCLLVFLWNHVVISRMLLTKKNNPQIYARIMNLMDHSQVCNLLKNILQLKIISTRRRGRQKDNFWWPLWKFTSCHSYFLNLVSLSILNRKIFLDYFLAFDLIKSLVSGKQPPILYIIDGKCDREK